MNEEIKKAVEQCLSGDSCEGCPFIDDSDCEESMKKGSLEALEAADITIAYLTALNNKLALELENSLLMKGKEKTDG